MKMPIDIVYRGVEKNAALDQLIHTKAENLETVCDHIIGCHIAIEKAHENPEHGTPYRVRLDLTVPPQHEIVVDRNPGKGIQYTPLETLVRDAFDVAKRQLRDLTEQQQNRTKQHPEQAVAGIITKLFPSQGYGFLKDLDGREIYFHRNSVIHEDYAQLSVGAGVQFFVSEGQNGPQASTVRLLDQPGIRPPQTRQPSEEAEAPLGWNYTQK
jgi:cold shock CspA family protein/ribosome-associated translation inhibitor RaiA